MFSLRSIYIALMLVAGVVVTAWPAIAALPAPPISETNAALQI